MKTFHWLFRNISPITKAYYYSILLQLGYIVASANMKDVRQREIRVTVKEGALKTSDLEDDGRSHNSHQ